jgi:GNAT superfamily N-acetyltransferase
VFIEHRPPDDSELTALVVDQQVELRVRDGTLDPQVTAVDPTARYLVAVVDGAAVACGALSVLDINTAELKRMYVRPAFRGRGYGRRMLRALEDFAVARGHTVVRLETGVYLPDAIALYLGAGYRPIRRFGPYVRNEYSRCFERRVDGTEPDVRVMRRPLADPDVVALLAAAVAELDRRYGEEGELVRPLEPAARVLIATLDSVAVACGAIQPLDDRTAEIRRMYVRPECRGNGIGRRVLAALEDLAAGSQYSIAQLETGARQPEAIAMYRSAGYTDIPPFGPYLANPFSVCLRKTLIATGQLGD